MIPSRTPRLFEVIDSGICSKLSDVHVGLPGRVESYDADSQTAQIKPLIKYRSSTDEEAVSLPVLNNVPIIFPSASGYRITFPVQAGDTVHLSFCESSIDKWLSEGGEVDPGDVRRHHLSDAVAYVGLHDSKHPLRGASTNSMTLGKDNGPQIEITEREIKIIASSKITVVAPTVDIGDASTVVTLSGGVLPIARQSDMAGPYPISGPCNPIVKG